MGDVDELINGEVCDMCHVYFKTAHGHPATCKDCWRKLTKADKARFHQKATEEIENK